MNGLNVGQEFGPNGYQAPGRTLTRADGSPLFPPGFWGYGPSPVPPEVSTGELMVGIGTTALGALEMTKAGITIPHVLWTAYPGGKMR